MASNPVTPTVLEHVRLDHVDELSSAAGEVGAVLAARRHAREVLAGTPLPSRARHLWRYTDPAAFLPASDPTVIVPDTVTAGWRLDDEVAGSALVAGGALRQVELSDEARRAGVEIVDLHTTPTDLLGSVVGPEHGFVEAVNGAAWRGGVLVRVPAGVRLSAPIRLRFVAPGGTAVALPRVLVDAGAGSEVEVVEGHVGGEADTRVLTVAEIVVGENAAVRYGAVQRWGRGVVGHSTAYARLERDARFQMALASFGGSIAKADVGAYLDGPGSHSEIFGVALGSDRQRFDHHTEHIHRAGSTTSNLDVKVALTDAARSAYTGVIRIAEHARECEAYQENRNLLLSSDARAESIPELEILNEDVRCSHGATVAPLEDEQLFYLASRGLAHNHAVRLIVYGFLDQTLRRLPESSREHIQAIIAERLHTE